MSAIVRTFQVLSPQRSFGFTPSLSIQRDHTRHAQVRHQNGHFVMIVRKAHPQRVALHAAAMTAGHFSSSPGFIDKHKTLRPQIDLALEPFITRLQDVGSVLLDGMASFLLRIMPRRRKSGAGKAAQSGERDDRTHLGHS